MPTAQEPNDEGETKRHCCIRCSRDISQRAPQARYCKECARVTQRSQKREWATKNRTFLRQKRTKRPRYCKTCGKDITKRYHNAIYCKICAQNQIELFNLYKRPRRQRYYNRGWMFKIGTTDLGAHTRIRINENGSIDPKSIEKELQVIKNERKRLALMKKYKDKERGKRQPREPFLLYD